MSSRINGGFFWEGGGVQLGKGVTDFEISNNVFMGRPKWYQLRRWLQVFKAVLNLPHN
jgi:hypothetical protein